MKNEYQLRGNRVAIQSLQDITAMANFLCKACRFRKNKPIPFDKLMEALRGIDIEYDIVEDEDWLPITRGCFNPSTGIISLPLSVYLGACNNNYEDLHIGLHEVGHAMMRHKPLLHYSLLPAVKEEDAEWQADMFADAIMKRIGITKNIQLDLFLQR